MDGGGLVMPYLRVSPVVAMVRGAKGFTLIELMVTLGILVIVLSVAMPAYQSIIQNNRVRAVTTDLHSALVLARSEAVKRNANVVVTAVSGQWGNGWGITAGAITVASQGSLAGVVIVGSATSVTFSPSGRANAAVDFSVTSTGGEADTRYLCLGVDGRAESGKEAC